MDRYSDRGYRERDYPSHYGERGFLDRFTDEVRSWFGDEEAQRRRMRDEHEEWRGGQSRDWAARDWGRSSWGPPDWSRGDWRRPEWDRGDRARGDWRRDWRGEGARGQSDWSRGPDERELAREWGFIEGRGGYGSGGHINVNTGYSSNAYGAGGFSSSYGRGEHAGRGPRNYQRTDDRIREDLCERLTEHSHIDASDLDIRVQNGEVTLTGTVSDRWAKRTAEDIADGVSGVKEVHNEIRVTQGQERPEDRDDANRRRGTWAA